MHLTEAATALLFRESVRRHFDAGDVILREGDVPTSLFWLASGEAAVRLPNWPFARDDLTIWRRR